jgi:hypothetical protein
MKEGRECLYYVCGGFRYLNILDLHILVPFHICRDGQITVSDFDNDYTFRLFTP